MMHGVVQEEAHMMVKDIIWACLTLDLKERALKPSEEGLA